MKRIWAIGKREESDAVCGVFRSVNAEAIAFLDTDSVLTAGKANLPHLVVVAFDIASKSDLAIQEIRKDPNLKAVQVLVYYPSFTARPEVRGRLAGANEILVLPLERRELLARSASLLRIEKRRTFNTLLTVESAGRSVIAKSQDFSTAGLSFVADRSLLENEGVRIYMFLPGSSERICLNATIARKTSLNAGEFHYGAQFVENEKPLLDRVADFVDRGK